MCTAPFTKRLSFTSDYIESGPYQCIIYVCWNAGIDCPRVNGVFTCGAVITGRDGGSGTRDNQIGQDRSVHLTKKFSCYNRLHFC